MLLQGFFTAVLLSNIKYYQCFAPNSLLTEQQQHIQTIIVVYIGEVRDKLFDMCYEEAWKEMRWFIIDRTLMFRQFLQLDLKQPHDKQTYSLKKNQLIIKQTSQAVNFDAICYSSQDISSKIVLQMVHVASNPQLTNPNPNCSLPTITATFNYNLEVKDLIQLMERIYAVKMFAKSKIRIGHFEVRNGHISDFYRSRNGGEQLVDDLDQFEKEIHNCLQLERLWKINEYLTYVESTPSRVQKEVKLHLTQLTLSNKKFGKRTNEFFLLELEAGVRIILIILPRSSEFVLSREEEREIEEAYIINKHKKEGKVQKISFSTPLAQIINNYLQQAAVNILLTSYPQQQRTLPDTMKLPLRLGNPHHQQIQQILQNYTQDKLHEMEHQSEKLRKRFRELQYTVKNQQDGMQRLIKVYSKTFNKSFSSIEYLRHKGVSSVQGYLNLLHQQIREKQQEIEAQEAALKQLHQEIIREEERHLFYATKITKYREEVMAPFLATTPTTSKHSTRHDQKENFEPTEQELLYFYDPQKEINRYRQLKEEELKAKLAASPERRNFLKLMEEAKFKMGKAEFNKLEQDYYDLLSS